LTVNADILKAVEEAGFEFLDFTKAKATTFGGWSEATLPARPCNRGGYG
jgi:hypothetical protein